MASALKIKIKKIDDGYHLWCNAKINGEKALLVVDTGASKTVLDQTRSGRFIKKEGLKRNEQLSTGLGTNSMESHVLKSCKIELTKKEFRQSLVIMDLNNINIGYGQLNLKPVDGVLGCDILKKLGAVIDLNKKEIRFKK